MQELTKKSIGIFLNLPNKVDGLSLPMIPISEIDKVLKDYGFEKDKDGNTNGYQIDFLYYYKHENFGKYILSGSLWYGEFKLIHLL